MSVGDFIDAINKHPGATDETVLLEKLPNLTTMPCDGHTLAHTPSASVDLVHANKVFVYLPFAVVAGYLNEMARVVRPGGTVAFDVVTEGCLDDRTVDSWVAAQGSIYLPIPRPWVLDYLAAKDLTLRGSWFVPMTGGRTELLVFRRHTAD
jgi:SAM-dependent methyltransferase